MAKKTANKKTDDLLMIMESTRRKHERWKKGNYSKKVGFYPVFKDFKYTHLADISGGALKAYLYFGLHSNNDTGECWHSTERMSEFFGVDIRTIKKWITELEERKLIYRVQIGFNRAANTFLLPYKVPDIEGILNGDLEDWEAFDFGKEEVEQDEEIVGPIQVCRSNAGYYIGRMLLSGEPYSRISAEYFETVEEAKLALEYNSWTERGN